MIQIQVLQAWGLCHQFTHKGARGRDGCEQGKDMYLDDKD